MIFSWDEWNLTHIGRHSVIATEAEHVVKHATRPFPRARGEGKFQVWGQTAAGRYLQVIFVYRPRDEVDYESLNLVDLLAVESEEGPIIYVIHAMDLTANMKRQYRKLME